MCEAQTAPGGKQRWTKWSPLLSCSHSRRGDKASMQITVTQGKIWQVPKTTTSDLLRKHRGRRKQFSQCGRLSWGFWICWQVMESTFTTKQQKQWHVKSETSPSLKGPQLTQQRLWASCPFLLPGLSLLPSYWLLSLLFFPLSSPTRSKKMEYYLHCLDRLASISISKMEGSRPQGQLEK